MAQAGASSGTVPARMRGGRNPARLLFATCRQYAHGARDRIRAASDAGRAASTARGASSRPPPATCATHRALCLGRRSRRSRRRRDRARRREHTQRQGELGVRLDAPVARLDHPRHGTPWMALGNRDERGLPIPHTTQNPDALNRKPTAVQDLTRGRENIEWGSCARSAPSGRTSLIGLAMPVRGRSVVSGVLGERRAH
jgi:hypothetical protein